jgi:hypothetical protein
MNSDNPITGGGDNWSSPGAFNGFGSAGIFEDDM